MFKFQIWDFKEIALFLHFFYYHLIFFNKAKQEVQCLLFSVKIIIIMLMSRYYRLIIFQCVACATELIRGVSYLHPIFEFEFEKKKRRKDVF